MKIRITKDFENRVCDEIIVDTPKYRYRYREDYNTNKRWIERLERKDLETAHVITGWQFVKWVGEEEDK